MTANPKYKKRSKHSGLHLSDAAFMLQLVLETLEEIRDELAAPKGDRDDQD